MTGVEGVFPKVDGDDLYASEVNIQVSNFATIEAGENVTSGNVVYVHLTDGKVYVGDTGTPDDIRATGIAVTTATIGNDVTIQTGGKYITTGLTDKAAYYLGASGAISETLSGVRIGTALSTTEFLINIIQDDKDVVGTIKPWDKSITGMPSNMLTSFWRECDGSAISDTESPLNGQNVRDLNNANNRFLRGSGTSGGTGGNTNTSGLTSGVYGLQRTSVDPGGYDINGIGNHIHMLNEPPYMNMVMIMKIK